MKKKKIVVYISCSAGRTHFAPTNYLFIFFYFFLGGGNSYTGPLMPTQFSKDIYNLGLPTDNSIKVGGRDRCIYLPTRLVAGQIILSTA